MHPLRSAFALALLLAAACRGRDEPPARGGAAAGTSDSAPAAPGAPTMGPAAGWARVEVDSGATIATAAGARIGDGEERVRSLYPGRVAMTPHKYVAGHHYLTVTPAAADSAYRLVFETDGQRVTRYRAGRRPAVEYVEGCG
jgi:hypothetical protein